MIWSPAARHCVCMSGFIKQRLWLRRRAVHSPFECKVVDEQVSSVCVCVWGGGNSEFWEKNELKLVH